MEAGINFKHLCPELDPKLKHIEPHIALMGAAVSIVDYDNDGLAPKQRGYGFNNMNHALYTIRDSTIIILRIICRSA